MFSRYLDSRPRTEIWIGQKLYLTKWYLGKVFGYKVNIHRFTGPDVGRAPHNHPWDKAFSFILRGWYWERRVTGVDTAGDLVYSEGKVRWFNRLNGMDVHKVEALGTEEVWTLFFMGKRQQHWGFLAKTPAYRPMDNHVSTRFEYIPYEEMQNENQYVKDFGYFDAIRN